MNYGIVTVFLFLLVAGCAKHESKIKTRNEQFVLSDSEVSARNEDNASQYKVKNQGARDLVDTMVARVNGVNILQSTLAEPRIDKKHASVTLEDAITEELLCQKAVEMKIFPTELEVERRIASVRDQNGYAYRSDEDFEAWILREAGLSMSRFKKQIRRVTASEHVKNMYVQDKGFVEPAAIEKFYNENPVYEDARYEIKSAFVEKEQLDDDNKLKSHDDLEWIDLGWVKAHDIAQEMLFVTDLAIGVVSKSIETEVGAQVFKLENKQDKKLKTLDERYVEIEKKLHSGQREEFENDLIKQLRGKASIVYLAIK